jgi:ankyrin repeat protein
MLIGPLKDPPEVVMPYLDSCRMGYLFGDTCKRGYKCVKEEWDADHRCSPKVPTAADVNILLSYPMEEDTRILYLRSLLAKDKTHRLAHEVDAISGLTPLCMAAKYHKDRIIPVLLENGAQRSTLCGDTTPLMYAMFGRYYISPRTIDQLLVPIEGNDPGIEVRSRTRDDGLLTPLLLLSRNYVVIVESREEDSEIKLDNAIEILGKFLAAGANPSSVDDKGRTPLWYVLRYTTTSTNKNLVFIQKLLDAGADINAIDTEGNTLLMCAALSSNPETTRLMMAHYKAHNPAIIQAKNKKGMSAFMLAPRPRIAVELIDSATDADIKIIAAKRYTNGKTLLMSAASIPNKIELLLHLLDLGSRRSDMDPTGATALMYAVDYGILENVQALLEPREGNDNAINARDSKGETALFKAMTKKKIPIVNALLGAGANVSIPTEGGNRLIIVAVTVLKDVGLVRSLLDHGAQRSTTQGDGNTALMYAVELGMLEIVQALLEPREGNDTGINARNSEGETALYKAVVGNNIPIVNALLGAGANVSNPTEPLVLVAVTVLKSVELVRILLDHGAQRSMTLEDGNTALMYAVELEMLEIIQALLEPREGNDTGINLQNAKGETALFIAMYKNNSDIVDLLLLNGADVNIVSLGGTTVLGYAALRKDSETVYKFLTTVDPADPMLGRPPVISQRSTFSEEVQAIFDIYYKPLNVWEGRKVDELDSYIFNTTVTNPDAPVASQRSLQLDFVLCPVCTTPVVRDRACDYIRGHDCRVQAKYYNHALYDKYVEEGAITWCCICGRICSHEEKHYALVPANAARPGLSGFGTEGTRTKYVIPRGEEGRGGVFGSDCRQMSNHGGGGLVEKVMRIHVYREQVKWLQDNGKIGIMKEQDAVDKLTTEMWNAVTADANQKDHPLYTTAKRELEARRFDLVPEMFRYEMSKTAEPVDSIVYRTIWNVYKYPTLPWPSQTNPAFHPIVSPTVYNASEWEEVPNGIVFKHLQENGTVRLHDIENPAEPEGPSEKFSLHRLFVGGLGEETTLTYKNANWTQTGNFGACFVCTRISTTEPSMAIKCSIYPGITKGPCTSKLYPQELQMALDGCGGLSAEERARYQAILDEYTLKFNKKFASPKERKKGDRIDKAYYLKTERTKQMVATGGAGRNRRTRSHGRNRRERRKSRRASGRSSRRASGRASRRASGRSSRRASGRSSGRSFGRASGR